MAFLPLDIRQVVQGFVEFINRKYDLDFQELSIEGVVNDMYLFGQRFSGHLYNLQWRGSEETYSRFEQSKISIRKEIKIFIKQWKQQQNKIRNIFRKTCNNDLAQEIFKYYGIDNLKIKLTYSVGCRLDKSNLIYVPHGRAYLYVKKAPYYCFPLDTIHRVRVEFEGIIRPIILFSSCLEDEEAEPEEMSNLKNETLENLEFIGELLHPEKNNYSFLKVLEGGQLVLEDGSQINIQSKLVKAEDLDPVFYEPPFDLQERYPIYKYISSLFRAYQRPGCISSDNLNPLELLYENTSYCIQEFENPKFSEYMDSDKITFRGKELLEEIQEILFAAQYIASLSKYWLVASLKNGYDIVIRVILDHMEDDIAITVTFLGAKDGVREKDPEKFSRTECREFALSIPFRATNNFHNFRDYEILIGGDKIKQ